MESGPLRKDAPAPALQGFLDLVLITNIAILLPTDLRILSPSMMLLFGLGKLFYGTLSPFLNTISKISGLSCSLSDYSPRQRRRHPLRRSLPCPQYVYPPPPPQLPSFYSQFQKLYYMTANIRRQTFEHLQPLYHTTWKRFSLMHKADSSRFTSQFSWMG